MQLFEEQSDWTGSMIGVQVTGSSLHLPSLMSQMTGEQLRRRQRAKNIAMALALLALVGVVGLNVTLYTAIDKGFMPEQDTGRISGFIRADQATSYQAMEQRLQRFLAIVQADPAVEYVTGTTGGWQRNAAAMFMTLKRGPGQESSEVVIARLREQLKNEPGARLFMSPQRDIRIGGRQSGASFDYTLQADDITELRTWEPRIRQALSQLPEL